MGPQTRLRKLFSLSGVAPLGMFLVIHVVMNAPLLHSHSSYERWNARQPDRPLSLVLELLLMAVPLTIHAGVGLWMSIASAPRRQRNTEHAYESLLLLWLERISGVVVLLFIALHLWSTRAQTLTGHSTFRSYPTMLAEYLSSSAYGVPWAALAYVLGLAATVFHFVVGMSSFCASWGIVQSRRGAQRARYGFRGLGIALFGIGTATVIQLAAGASVAFDPPTGPPCGLSAAETR